MNTTQTPQSAEQSLSFEDTIFSLPPDHRPTPLDFNPSKVDRPLLSFDEERTDSLSLPSAGMQSEDAQITRELQQAATAALSQAPAASTHELAAVLDGFASVLRGEYVIASDRSAEIVQMKELLLEAQETIINLLNDRVHDRARIAKLEAENRILPDLQSQATRAMGLAMRSEDVQQELVQLRTELERLRAAYVRNEQTAGTWFSRLFGRK